MGGYSVIRENLVEIDLSLSQASCGAIEENLHYFESRPLEFAFFESRTFFICAHYTVTKIPNSYSQIFNCETTLYQL
jgi:hypothetical protein